MPAEPARPMYLRLNALPFVLVPGFAIVGYALGGWTAAGWCVGGWCGVVALATLCAAVRAFWQAPQPRSTPSGRVETIDADSNL